MSVKKKDLVGQKFNRLLVIGEAPDYWGPNAKKGSIRWTCLCDCGKETITYGSHLKNGSSKSCGCFSKEVNTDHGLTRTREHNIWCGMKQRCYDTNCKDFPAYGAKGIAVFPDWFGSFTKFLDYMGPCPEGMSLDRWPNQEGNYEPGNVRWATLSEQSHNRGMLKNNKSGKKGVFELKSGGGFQASIMFEKKKIHLGTFQTFEEAKFAREQAELEYLGEIKDC